MPKVGLQPRGAEWVEKEDSGTTLARNLTLATISWEQDEQRRPSAPPGKVTLPLGVGSDGPLCSHLHHRTVDFLSR